MSPLCEKVRVSYRKIALNLQRMWLMWFITVSNKIEMLNYYSKTFQLPHS